MPILFSIIGVFCLIYYVVIFVYTGQAPAFSSIWLILAGILFLLAVLSYLYSRYRDQLPLSVKVSCITVAAAFFAVFVITEIVIAGNFFSFKKQSVDYLIVLGTQVKGETMSRSLQYRMDKALEYAQIHPNTMLVLSGGKGDGENRSEAAVMYDYLKENGVPDYQMMKEEFSESTYENIIYSKIMIDDREVMRRTTIRDIMSANGYLVPPDEDVKIHVGIVTSNFHMSRAKGIAKKAGIQDPYGIPSKSDPVMFLHFCMRECFAVLKDKFMGNM